MVVVWLNGWRRVLLRAGSRICFLKFSLTRLGSGGGKSAKGVSNRSRRTWSIDPPELLAQPTVTHRDIGADSAGTQAAVSIVARVAGLPKHRRFLMFLPLYSLLIGIGGQPDRMLDGIADGLLRGTRIRLPARIYQLPGALPVPATRARPAGGGRLADLGLSGGQNIHGAFTGGRGRGAVAAFFPCSREEMEIGRGKRTEHADHAVDLWERTRADARSADTWRDHRQSDARV